MADPKPPSEFETAARQALMGADPVVAPQHQRVIDAKRTISSNKAMVDSLVGQSVLNNTDPNSDKVRSFSNEVDMDQLTKGPRPLPVKPRVMPDLTKDGIAWRQQNPAGSTAQMMESAYRGLMGKPEMSPDELENFKQMGTAQSLSRAATQGGGLLNAAAMTPTGGGQEQLEKAYRRTVNPQTNEKYDMSVPTDMLDYYYGKPGGAIRGAIHGALKPGGSALLGAAAGWSPTYKDERASGGDIAGDLGIKNPWLKALVGFGIDVATDPFTLGSVGATGHVEQAVKQAGRGISTAAKTAGIGAEEASTFNKAAAQAVRDAYATSTKNGLADAAHMGVRDSLLKANASPEFAQAAMEAFGKETGYGNASYGQSHAPSLGKAGLELKVPIPGINKRIEVIPREKYAAPLRNLAEAGQAAVRQSSPEFYKAAKAALNAVPEALVPGYASGEAFHNDVKLRNNIHAASFADRSDLKSVSKYGVNDQERQAKIWDSLESGLEMSHPDDKPIVDALKGQMTGFNTLEKGKGLKYNDVENYVPHMLAEGNKGIFSGDKIGGPGFMKDRKAVHENWNKDTRELWAARAHASDKAIADKELFDKQTERFGIQFDASGNPELPPDLKRKLIADQELGGVAGLRAEKEADKIAAVVDAIREMKAVKKPASGIGKALNGSLAWTKAWLTQPKVGYHIGNMLGDSANMAAEGINPRSLIQGAKMSATDKGLIEKYANEVLPKTGTTIGQELEQAKKLGVSSPRLETRPIEEVVRQKIEDSQKSMGQKLASLATSTVDPRPSKNTFIKAGQEVGDTLEGHRRYSMYLDGRAKGLSPELAADRAADVMYDFKDITPFEQKGPAKAFTFYSYQKKNTAKQLRNLVENPAAIGAQLNARHEINQATDEQMPTDQRWKKRYMEQAFGVRLPMRDQDGAQLNYSPRLPLGEINKLPNPFANRMDAVDDTVAQLRPGIKTLYELGANRSVLTHGEVSHKGDEMEPVKDVASALYAHLFGRGGVFPSVSPDNASAGVNSAYSREDLGPRVNKTLAKTFQDLLPNVNKAYKGGAAGVLGLDLNNSVPGVGVFPYSEPKERERTLQKLGDEAKSLMNMEGPAGLNNTPLGVIPSAKKHQRKK